ncbi:class I SAM-dependent methyltransferase [Spirosoma foliorum]|uniref:Class I SAM-dependent methyltransferase n=1 Tax=Spirosoma foliorum TaxID=2710596 RepID=A0A7G5GZC0_9BACT|nr:class I SAM-dependent methyltransferase [Spirosoma foliorum]QMW04212.1 class I SAM-dependent methyltransferase [Spirosoma foliorum]
MKEEPLDLSGTASIFHFHKTLIERHGAGTTRALGWRKIEGQWMRFEKLSQIGDLSGHSVLDAGCGHADLFAFLKKRFSSITYYGCEQIPELLQIATQRYQRENNVLLLQGSFLDTTMPMTDFVLASGSLTYRHSDDEFVYKAIETLFAKCRIALGFNLLSGGVEPNTLLRSYSPDEILQFCQTLSKTVQLQVGYWPDDFTIFLYKE